MRLLLLLFLLASLNLCLGAEAAAPAKGTVSFKIPGQMYDLLETYCFDCHDDSSQKGDLQLDTLEELTLVQRLDLLNQVQEHLYSGEMPPKKKDQPEDAEREALLAWVWGELKIYNASKLEDKLRYYRYGNYLNHEKLFSGKSKEEPFSRARRWRINEMIYHERINDILELKGRDRQASFYGVVKPFNLPTEPGVKYYDTEAVEGGQFLTLMANAKWVVAKQLKAALLKSGRYQYPDGYLEMKKENPRRIRSTFPDELWLPKTTAPAFSQIINGDGTPSDAEFEAALAHQFQVTLQRTPSDAEKTRYLDFLKKTMAVSDKIIALKKMMISVLMEPEFLYRYEFGCDERDDSGRRMLTPREASYAISYALTDRIPDEELAKAADSKRLNSKEDYEREILRILDDENINKPRILRFFQDYFGYHGIYDVFKDEERFIGNYNPHRVVSTTFIYRIPGKISKEADTLVEWILKEDQNVFETLLTTDKFFVQHNGDNEEMIEQARKAAEKENEDRETYLKLKDFKGKERAAEAKKLGLYHLANGKTQRSLGYDMVTFAELFGGDGTRGKGRRPIPKDRLEHSLKMYNLDYRTWSYEPVQPVKLSNRSGILTHPSWLVSFSHNAATDPILRGKWIREKLLAGFIQDVPITVDAKVPEDPHRSLRERFSVTEEKSCWHCHRKMNPLGYVLESYDDFGRFRIEEMLEDPENVTETFKQSERGVHGPYKTYTVPIYKTKTVDSTGFLEGTGDPKLDGPVKDAEDLMARLAKSDRVRQSFIRHVFRYFMGRNETLSDSQTLVDADKVYLKSGGSFKALMISILTSDSFIYRK